MLHLGYTLTPHPPSVPKYKRATSHLFLSPDKARGASHLHSPEASPPLWQLVWGSLLPRWAGLRGSEGSPGPGARPSALGQHGPTGPTSKRASDGSSGLLPTQRMAKLAEAICSWL